MNQSTTSSMLYQMLSLSAFQESPWVNMQSLRYTRNLIFEVKGSKNNRIITYSWFTQWGITTETHKKPEEFYKMCCLNIASLIQGLPEASEGMPCCCTMSQALCRGASQVHMLVIEGAGTNLAESCGSREGCQNMWWLCRSGAEILPD